ncbi:MAG TPA: hypothetical protein VHB02_00385 [Acidimicrobiales bacterium]|nr:hypothetical protein [Acidimicrobiales bacterium]
MTAAPAGPAGPGGAASPGGPGGRLFTDEELAAVGRSPWRAAADAVRQGRYDDARVLVARTEDNCRAQMDRYNGWLGSIALAAAERWGQAGGTMLAVATRRFFAASPDLAATGADDPPPLVELAVVELERWLERWRRTIDFHRDWISALLSAVYRTHGVDALEAVLRTCGAQGLMGSVEAFNRRDARDRLVSFVALLHGHFTELDVTEDDRKFVIAQDPCGTCSRQVLDGRYGPPVDLAVVEERHPATWGRGTTTIYRSHVPVWHVEMAREHFGVPWPVNQCPHGVDGGPCRILLYKDPYDPEANDQVPGGA